MIRVLDASFLTTAVEEAGWPAADVPEIAFVGRSNVGKSSMINALTGRRKLVRVSNTPGRTRTLNFFDVLLERESCAGPSVSPTFRVTASRRCHVTSARAGSG